jgi:hypothetical protein
MSRSCSYSPETVELMRAVYRLAVKELKLHRASRHEHEKLAMCIFSIGSTYGDRHQLLDKAVRLYARSRNRHFSTDVEGISKNA